jgi:hypothetical protein
MKLIEKKWFKVVLGSIGALVAGAAIMLGGVLVGNTAVSQLVGLAVAQSATLWNNVADAAKGNGLPNGILSQALYVHNGTTFDRITGDITNGLDVDITRLPGATTPADGFANPTNALTSWALNGIWNGSTWDRWTGRVSNVEQQSLFNTSTTGAAATIVTVTLSAVAGQRSHIYSVDGRCNTAAETSSITITDNGGTLIWSSGVAAVTAAAPYYSHTWPTGLTGTTNTVMTINLGACATGTGTLMVQADKGPA